MNHEGHVLFSESNDNESLVRDEASLIIKKHDATALINGYIIFIITHIHVFCLVAEA